MHFTGTSGNDDLTGTTGADTFKMGQGGEDTVHGGGGDDIFDFGAKFDANDKIDGGSGNDTLDLNGDYSAGVIFNATTMVDVENLVVSAGNNYTLLGVSLAAGSTLTVDASALGANNTLNFETGFQSAGRFVITGGKGADVLFGGPGNDVIDGGAGGDTIRPMSGTDQVKGEGGNDFTDFFAQGELFNVNDRINGGAGEDFVNIEGNTYTQPIVFKDTTFESVEVIGFVGGSFNVTTVDANVTAHTDLDVFAGGLTATERLIFNGNAETDGSFLITGGAGNDVLTGGASGNSILGLGGKDKLAGGPGQDIFNYDSVSDSTGKQYDTVIGFDANIDRFALVTFSIAVTTVDSAVTSGALSTSSFNNDLARAIGSQELGAHHAVLFDPDSGSLAGKTFLIIDTNGQAGYQIKADLVIELSGATHLASLSPSNFET